MTIAWTKGARALAGMFLLGCGGVAPEPASPPTPAPPASRESAADGCKPAGTHYNDVRQISSHNAYDRCGTNPLRCTPKGDLAAQANAGVRSFELDLHAANRGLIAADPPRSDWAVFHATNILHGGDHCHLLSECLAKLRAWHDGHPTADVITIWLEMTDGWHTGGHAAIDLDANRIEAQLGDVLFRPSDLLATCPEAHTLQEAVTMCSWPTLEALRGKFIVVLMGNDGAAQRYLDEADEYRPRRHGRYEGPRSCFVAPDLAGKAKGSELSDAHWRNAVFFNAHNTSALDTAALAFDKHVITRVWKVDGADQWAAARRARAHHLATDEVMTGLLSEPRAVDTCGAPFEIIR